MQPAQSIQRFLVMAAAMILVLGALWWAREVIVPLVLAVLVSFILAPGVTALERFRLGRVFAVVLVVMTALVVIGGLGAALVVQVAQLAEDLPQYHTQIASKIEELRDAGQANWLDNLWNAAGDVAQQVKQAGKKVAAADAADPVMVELRPPMFSHIQSAAHSFLGFLLQAGLVLILVIFMLSQREDLRNRLIRLWGHGNLTGMTRALDDMGQRLSRFLRMQLLINLAFGATVGGGLTVIGLAHNGEPFPYAFVAAILGAVLRYLPYLGAWIATIFPVFVALAVYPSWGPLVGVLALILALEVVIGNFVEPVLYGHSIGVSEVALLVAAAFWAWLWGPIGLILAPPMTVGMAVAGRFIPQLEFLDILLSNKPALETHFRFFQRLLARDHDEAIELVEDHVREHPDREVFDDVLVPALLLAERHQKLGQLSLEEATTVCQAMREIVDEIDLVKAPVAEDAPAGPPVLVWGVPARDEADELILHMLGRMLPDRKCLFKTASPKTLASEFIETVRLEKPAIVCLGVLPVNRVAHARYLCFRLRSEFPDLKILVVCVGVEAQRAEVQERLRGAGADEVSGTLAKARSWLLPRLTMTPSAPAPGAPRESAA